MDELTALLPWNLTPERLLIPGLILGCSCLDAYKANGLEPYFYLRYLFLHFPTFSVDELTALLPWNLTPERLLIPLDFGV